VAVALALPLSVPATARAPELGSSRMLLGTAAEALVGLTLGVFVMLAVAAIQAVGELLDLVGGFTMSAALDPLLMVQSSVLGRLHQLTAAAVLFATDGHLMVLHGLASTPGLGSGTLLDPEQVARAATRDVAAMFLAAIQIAAPVIAAMLVADVALGLLTRAAPAMNPFSLSFPLKIALMLLLGGLVLTRLPEALNTSVEHAVITALDLAHAAGR
jgi:flagellar biosynthetic protein FliR